LVIADEAKVRLHGEADRTRHDFFCDCAALSRYQSTSEAFSSVVKWEFADDYGPLVQNLAAARFDRVCNMFWTEAFFETGGGD
jgi:hypothetical protein